MKRRPKNGIWIRGKSTCLTWAGNWCDTLQETKINDYEIRICHVGWTTDQRLDDEHHAEVEIRFGPRWRTEIWFFTRDEDDLACKPRNNQYRHIYEQPSPALFGME